jgi:hypothetical protein
MKQEDAEGDEESDEAATPAATIDAGRLNRRVTLTEVLDSSENKEPLYNPLKLTHQESISRRAPPKPVQSAKQLEEEPQKAIERGDIVLKPESSFINTDVSSLLSRLKV